MHRRQLPPDSLLRIARHQSGVFTTEQTFLAGWSRRVLARARADSSVLDVTAGLHRLPSIPWSFGSQVWAGSLIGGQGARIGGLAAAHLVGLDDDRPVTVDVFVPAGRRVSRPDPRWRFRHERQGSRLPGWRGSPPRIGVEDLVLDLCDESSPADVAGWVTSAVQRRLTTSARLQERMDGRTRVRHRRLIRSLLADVDQGAQSALEVQYLRDVERAHGLPAGDRNQRRGSPFFTDVDYDPYAVIVELDGLKGHTGAGKFRDMGRDNLHTMSGRRTLRFGHPDVFGRPCAVAWQVAELLLQCGWSDFPVRCRRCRDSDEHLAP